MEQHHGTTSGKSRSHWPCTMDQRPIFPWSQDCSQSQNPKSSSKPHWETPADIKKWGCREDQIPLDLLPLQGILLKGWVLHGCLSPSSSSPHLPAWAKCSGEANVAHPHCSGGEAPLHQWLLGKADLIHTCILPSHYLRSPEFILDTTRALARLCPSPMCSPQHLHETITGFTWPVPEKTLPAACEQPVSGGRLSWSQQVLSFGVHGGILCHLLPVPCLFRPGDPNWPNLPIHHSPLPLPPCIPRPTSPGEMLGRRCGPRQGTWITRQKQPTARKSQGKHCVCSDLLLST